MHECTDSFITSIDGRRVTCDVGQRRDDDDELVKRFPQFFKKLPSDKPAKKRAARKATAAKADDGDDE